MEGSGICFIKFRTENQALDAIDMDGRKLAGQTLNVQIAKPPKDKDAGKDSRGLSRQRGGKGRGKQRKADPKQVFVCGLGDLRESDIRQFFEYVGEIERIKLLTTPEGNPKGIGFVTFRTERMADNSLDLNGERLAGKTIQVREAYAQK